jgi:hypothetical protein
MKRLAFTTTTLLATALFAAPAAAQEEAPRIVVQGFEADQSSMSLQLHASTLTLSDDAIDPQGSAQLGGLSFSWRWDLVPWGGLELGLSALSRQSESGLVQESRGLLSASFLWYFARHHKHRFYGITGLASLLTTVQIGANTHDYSEGGLVLGLGSEWLLGKRWLVSADARALFLSPENDHSGPRHDEDLAATPPNDGRARTPWPDAWTSAPEERAGLAFNLGVGYRW